MAKDMGADRVIVFDRLEPRLPLAREFGADHAVNADEYTSSLSWSVISPGAVATISFLSWRVWPICWSRVMLRNGGTFVEIGSEYTDWTWRSTRRRCS